MKRFGWYSEDMDNRYGHYVYRTIDGKEVKVCHVSASDTVSGLPYKLECVGQVTKCLRANLKKR